MVFGVVDLVEGGFVYVGWVKWVVGVWDGVCLIGGWLWLSCYIWWGFWL